MNDGEITLRHLTERIHGMSGGPGADDFGIDDDPTTPTATELQGSAETKASPACTGCTACQLRGIHIGAGGEQYSFGSMDASAPERPTRKPHKPHEEDYPRVDVV